MDKFSIGESAIITGPPGSRNIGEEVTVMSRLFKNDNAMVHGVYCGNWYGFWEPQYLRKKYPPQEPSTWEEVEKATGWNPTKQGVSCD